MVSQAILGIRWAFISPFHGSESETSYRTYNIAQRNIWIGRIVALAYSVATAVRYYCSLPDDWCPQMSTVPVVHCFIQPARCVEQPLP